MRLAVVLGEAALGYGAVGSAAPMRSRREQIAKKLAAVAALCTCCALLPPAHASDNRPSRTDDVVHVQNGEAPAHGRDSLELRKLWSLEALGNVAKEWGAITHVQMGADSKIYLLSPTLGVVVLSMDGEHISTLSHKGVAPDRFSTALGFVVLPMDRVGVIVNRCSMVLLSESGQALEGPLFHSAEHDRLFTLFGGLCRENHLVLAGVIQDFLSKFPDSSEQRWHAVLSRFDLGNGGETVRYLERSQDYDFDEYHVDERTEYFAAPGRWAMSIDGTVYAAPLRDEYQIHVFAPDGTHERVVSRAFAAPRRSDETLAALRSAYDKRLGIRGVEGTIALCATDPVSTGIRVQDDGELWVQRAGSVSKRTAGVLLTYDVFDKDGVYVQEVMCEVADGQTSDSFVWIDDQHLIRLAGVNGAAMNDPVGMGGGATYNESIPQANVTCYEIRD